MDEAVIVKTEWMTCVTIDGWLANVGPWNYKEVEVEVDTNPFPGPMTEPPPDWDFKTERVKMVTNPYPEGAIDEYLEVWTDDQGARRALRDKPAYDLSRNKDRWTEELKGLMVDIQLGMASPEELERAKWLRAKLKEV